MAQLTTGSEFAGHRIEALTGRGGMGVVYRATHLALDRAVALKVMAPALVEDPAARQRFLRESKLAASIDHPNVIPIYYAGDEDGVAFIAMRFVEGRDLRSLVREHGALESARAARIVAQVAAALDAAHATGLVHRDVKPANVLVAPDDHVYLSDFGLSKHALSLSGETRSGHWVGTLDYVAPEQIRGERPDARADVYALGGVLYFALTGQTPYPREGDEAKLWAHLTEPPPRATDCVPGLSPDFDAVIARALAKRPDDRYPSAGDLGRAALAAAGLEAPRRPERVVGVGAAAPQEAPTESGSHPAAARAAHDAETVVERPALRRRPALLAVGALGAVAVAVAVIGVVSRGGDADGGGGAGSASRAPTATPTARGSSTAGPRVRGTVHVGGRPNRLAIAGGTVFVTRNRDTRLTLVDEADVEKRRSRPAVGTGSVDIATGAGAVWVAVNGDPAVYSFDPATGRQRARMALPAKPRALAVGHGALWLGMSGATPGTPDVLARVDLRTRSIIDSFPVPKGIRALVSTPLGVWVLYRHNSGVARFDPRLERFERRVQVGRSPLGDATYGAGSLWVTSPQEDTVAKIDDRTGQQVAIGVGRRPTGIAARGRHVWVTSFIDHTITRIDPARSRTTGKPVDVPLNPYALAIARDSVWLTALGRGAVVRVRFAVRG